MAVAVILVVLYVILAAILIFFLAKTFQAGCSCSRYQSPPLASTPPSPSHRPAEVAAEIQLADLDLESGRQLAGRMLKAPDGDLVADFGDRGVFSIEETSCTICLVDYEHGDHIRRSPSCDHVFHKRCISEWLKTGKKECPCCRRTQN
jgi:hypothetical protein